MWDYLIVTASNDEQAAGYRGQLELRQRLGLLGDVDNVLVAADPGGKRVGSGGSTLFCLLQVLRHRMGTVSADSAELRKVLGGLRILIIHAGGDSRRLPAYGPCGKIFVPVPGESDSCLPMTLFDRQLPTYLALAAPPDGAGQVVITSGDVMLRFDPGQVKFDKPGLTGLGCYARPEQAANHGVYCGVDEAGKVKKFLQKPSVAEQKQMGATDHYGQSVLDVGVMNFDADTAVRLLEIFGVRASGDNKLELSGEMGRAVLECGLDFYRELCCAMGSEVSSSHHIEMSRSSGSAWDDVLLGRLLQGVGDIDFNLELLRHCDFIDFGTTANIIRSGSALVQEDRGASKLNSCIDVNNEFFSGGLLSGARSWVEGCRIDSKVTLAGDNVLIGVDVKKPLKLNTGECLDVLTGNLPGGGKTWFVRCYYVNDTFKDTLEQGAAFCGMPVMEWLDVVGADAGDVWDDSVEPGKRSLWDARVFPAVSAADDFRDWIWMHDPKSASGEQFEKWKRANRYSAAEIARMADQEYFFKHRLAIRAEVIKNSLRKIFRSDSEFSAEELACILTDVLADDKDRQVWIAAVISEAKWHYDNSSGLGTLMFSRIIHSLGSVLEDVNGQKGIAVSFKSLHGRLSEAENGWLDSIGLSLNSGMSIDDWILKAKDLAFNSLGRAIMFSGGEKFEPPQSRLRSDEIVWGRSPVRFDTGGGWTDTPPYSLEYGGCVVNTAIDLNGQSPLQAYLRVIDEPVIVIGSIDLGTRVRITELDELLDYRRATSKYGLVKAALALSGFSPEVAGWPEGITLRKMLEAFGGGVEITTLAAIPKGSGLGTSSILGAVIVAVIYRSMGRQLTHNELINKVLQLEQALTTGGGWQDQVGGVLGGAKIVFADAGLVPEPRVHYLPSDIIDPATNGASTLLYYTGITRLAKNILEQVVGAYLNRNRGSMATLGKIKGLTSQVAETLSRKNMAGFGRLVDQAWDLNKQLDPNSTNEEVEKLFARVEPFVYGTKLLGAGGGGFMFMVCKSPQDARRVRTMLDDDPPNDRSRFFDVNVNNEGLVVTVC